MDEKRIAQSIISFYDNTKSFGILKKHIENYNSKIVLEKNCFIFNDAIKSMGNVAASGSEDALNYLIDGTDNRTWLKKGYKFDINDHGWSQDIQSRSFVRSSIIGLGYSGRIQAKTSLINLYTEFQSNEAKFLYGNALREITLHVVGAIANIEKSSLFGSDSLFWDYQKFQRQITFPQIQRVTFVDNNPNLNYKNAKILGFSGAILCASDIKFFKNGDISEHLYNNKYSHKKWALAIGLNDRGFYSEYLIYVLESLYTGEVKENHFLGLMQILPALGHSARDGGLEAQEYLKKSCFPEKWLKNKVKWHFNEYKGEKLAIALARSGIWGLGYWASDESLKILKRLQEEYAKKDLSKYFERDISRAISIANNIKTHGAESALSIDTGFEVNR